MDIASKLGATATINIAEVANVPDAIRAAVGGELIDRVIDTTPHATAPVADAIELIRPGGVIVVAGLKGELNLDVVKADRIVLKAIDVRGVVSVASWGYAQAMKLIAADRGPLELLHTHTVPLGELQHGIDLLKSSQAVHVSIVP
jgi:threonine dehydrogenase-like Zn-dependent dehydrogenase